MYDVLIMGGGLAGLMAAEMAERLGASAALIDAGVPGTEGGLGGFAPFSGAKFSLFPAGTGIAPIVGGKDALIERYRQACASFAALGFSQFEISDLQLAGEETAVDCELSYRRYHSILLAPTEMNSLLSVLVERLSTTAIVRATVTGLDVSSSGKIEVLLANGMRVAGKHLVVATGRLGAQLLLAAGVPQTSGKGIDVGIRLAFRDRGPLAGLRNLGPDAKFMADGVRTFCLNSPGRIFHYPGMGFSLPGGIVADPDWAESNVGILCRLADREGVLTELHRHAPPVEAPPLEQEGNGVDLGWSASSQGIVGEKVVRQINAFVAKLVHSGLVALPPFYVVHYPLLDWYWPVFSRPGRLATGIPGIVAAGDISGHARGLMQAAVMGSLAVEEALR